jgi:predicted nucleic acid-binding protein
MSIGRPAGDMDTLIAAIALAHGQRLVTRNPKHFADVPGLIVESY